MKNRDIVLGLILIIIGALWILDNINIIDFDIGNIIRGILDLWPLILVAIGLSIIIKNKKAETIIWILFIIIVIVYSFIFKGNNFRNISNNSSTSETSSITMDQGIQKGKLELDIGATKFKINSSSNDLATISTDGNFNYYKKTNNNIGIVYLSNKDKRAVDFLDGNNNFFFDMKLDESIPWGIEVDAGAVNGELNLQDIAVEELDFELGAGNLEVNLGEKANHTDVNIDSGASKIVMNIPKGSGVSVNLEGGLNSTNLDELNLIEQNGRYITDGFQDASSKFVINIEMGLGRFEINYY